MGKHAHTHGNGNAHRTAGPDKLVFDAQLRRRFANNVVSDALAAKSSGDSDNYEKLRQGFTRKTTDPMALSSMELQYLILALTQHVSLLDSSSLSLVKAVVAMNWLGRSNSFVQTYVRFLGSLVSSRAEFTTLVLQMLARHLTLIHPSTGRIPTLEIVTRGQMHGRVHTALSHVLDLVPYARDSLIPLLVAEFPHKSEKAMAQTVYLENLLKVTTYVPAIEAAVLSVVIDKIVSIDVEIQIELEDVEDDEVQGVVEGLDKGYDAETDVVSDDDFDQANDNVPMAIGHDSDSEAEVEMTLTSMPLQAINDNIRKLDGMLLVVFQHLENVFKVSTASAQDMTRCDRTFEALVQALDSTILHTYQSRHTQFIVFWASQKHAWFTATLLRLVVERAQDASKPATHRMIAAAYVGSFTARAKTLSRRAVREVVASMVGWIEDFLDSRRHAQELTNRRDSMAAPPATHLRTTTSIRSTTQAEKPNHRDAVSRHGIFYAITQALFYIFCFRHQDLRGLDDDEPPEVPDSAPWLPGLQQTVERAVLDRRLNPLRHCNAAVVHEFARFSRVFRFVYCDTIVSNNKRMRYDAVGEIDSYFPFDPYRLKQSRHFVEEVYFEWRGLPGDDSDADDDDNDDDDSSDEDMRDA